MFLADPLSGHSFGGRVQILPLWDSFSSSGTPWAEAEITEWFGLGLRFENKPPNGIFGKPSEKAPE